MLKTNFVVIPALTDKTFDSFKKLIYRETGIFMRDSKRILVSNRLRKRVTALKLKGYDDYYRYLTSTAEGKKEIPNFVDALSTNETYFYRGDKQFEALKQVILPGLFKKQSKIKVWSAACSTGEEPYTICIVILETAGTSWKGEIEIIATDVNTEVIERAKEGVYSGRTLKFVSDELLKRYFDDLGNKKYGVQKILKEKIRFKCHNLLKDGPPATGFDIIFCRNVMIYFDRETQKSIVDNSFYKAIKDDGYLFIGHSESLMGKSERFKYVHVNKAPIYRPVTKK